MLAMCAYGKSEAAFLMRQCLAREESDRRVCCWLKKGERGGLLYVLQHTMLCMLL